MPKAKRFSLGPVVDYIGMAVALAALIAYFSMRSPRFLTPDNFLGMANQIPASIVVAVGMTYVLIIAGIDLSVGSLLGLSGAVLGIAMDKMGAPLPVALVLAIVAAGACGAVNGLVAVRWALPSFIVTLGMLEIGRGGTFLLTDTRTIYLGEKVGVLSNPLVGGLSTMFIVAVLIVVVAQWVLTRTVFGRLMVAIGTNEEAVRLSGIKTWPTKVAVFVVSGLMCGIGGAVVASRLQSANPNAGTGLELEAIAAVVIGGTSLAGGRGSVVNSFFGVLIMAVLSSGLAQVGAEEPTKRLITGLVIVLAVILDYYRSRITARKKAVAA